MFMVSYPMSNTVKQNNSDFNSQGTNCIFSGNGKNFTVKGTRKGSTNQSAIGSENLKIFEPYAPGQELVVRGKKLI